MDPDLKVYSDIYEIIKNNLENAGEQTIFTKESFLYAASQELNHVDMFDLLSYDNETFLQCLFIALFYRTIDEEARKNWEDKYDLSKTEFQKQALKKLMASQEFSLKHNTVLYNNIYADTNIDFSIEISQSSDGNSYIDKLYHIYYKLPAFIKNAIKVIIGRF